MTTTQQAEHQVIVTKYGRPRRGYKRVRLRCTVPGCFSGMIDGSPEAAVDGLVALIQAAPAEAHGRR